MVRRAIIDILWLNQRPMTKEEILTELITAPPEKHYFVGTQPTTNSLGSLLAKNPQIRRVGHERILSGDGRKRAVSLYQVNTDLIHEHSDILLTLPHNALSKLERPLALVCGGCGRTRIFPEGENRCLHCLRAQPS